MCVSTNAERGLNTNTCVGGAAIQMEVKVRAGENDRRRMKVMGVARVQSRALVASCHFIFLLWVVLLDTGDSNSNGVGGGVKSIPAALSISDIFFSGLWTRRVSFVSALRPLKGKEPMRELGILDGAWCTC